MVRQSGLHGWSAAERLVDTAKIVVREMERERMFVHPERLGECVRQSRESTTDSELLGADKMPARNQYVIIASTGGKWGKSRRDYAPRS